MPSHITVLLCFVFVGCGASSQNRLARRIDSLQRSLEALKAESVAERVKLQQNISQYSRKLDGLEAEFLTERRKQQQQISEYSRKLRDERERRQILETQIAQMRVAFEDVKTPRPSPKPTPRPTSPVRVRPITNFQTRRPTPNPTPRQTAPATRTSITTPVTRFVQAYGTSRDRVVIQDGGTAVRDVGLDRLASWTVVRTDGRLTAGRGYYWQVELDWSVASHSGLSGPLWGTVGGVGVRREGSSFSGGIGRDDQSWGVWIVYSFRQRNWRYECRHAGIASYRSGRVTYNSKVTNRLGFLLNAADKTLTVVEVNNNARLCSFGAVDWSTPLVPLVRFGIDLFERKFRLPILNLSRLPRPVTDLLRN